MIKSIIREQCFLKWNQKLSIRLYNCSFSIYPLGGSVYPSSLMWVRPSVLIHLHIWLYSPCSLSKVWVKSFSKRHLIQHFTSNLYEWSLVCKEAYRKHCKMIRGLIPSCFKILTLFITQYSEETGGKWEQI